MIDNDERTDASVMEPLLYSRNNIEDGNGTDNDTGSRERNTTEIVDKINPKNAKRFAVLLVLIFILYHSYIHLVYGKDSCRWLLSDGRYKNDMGWQPYGCMMHFYTEKDRTICIKYLTYRRHKNTFAFIGDDRMRDLYSTFVRHFIVPSSSESKNGVGLSDKSVMSSAVEPSDLSFSNESLQLKADFKWTPYISNITVELIQSWKRSKSIPSIIVIGYAIWPIKASNGSLTSVDDYFFNITRLQQSLESICDEARILWILQAPVNEQKLNASDAAITNKIIDLYNNAAIKALKNSCIDLWASSRLIAQGHLEDMRKGIGLDAESLSTDVQLLLNLYCNDHMNHNDGTCCASTEPYTYIQLSAFIILFICLISCCAHFLYLHTLLSGGFLRLKPFFKSKYSDFHTTVTSLSKLSLIMGFFYLCDRTNFFMKENKYYSPMSFYLPLAYVFTLGLFFTEQGRYTKILNREQTDECKGWMQLVILICQMTGAAETQLPIRNHILILASAYLFLSGYGHFTYAWFRSDAGIIRLLQVLFRLNFITVVSCFCMNRPYQFYYFVPVVTFWFLLLYVVFIFPPRVTSSSSENKPFQYVYVILKIVLLFVAISILYLSQVFFEKIFVTRPWKALFVTTDDDIENWWFRWKIDRYSALYGATFAFLLLMVQKFNFVDDNNRNNLFSVRVSFFVAVLALLGLLATSIYAVSCPNSVEFDNIQSYLSILPIVCYILLRNVSGILRTRYSMVFAFFGRISLELYVSHFHVWLSADSNGVLVLVPRYPVINSLVVSHIFVCISHELYCITRKLLPYAVPSDCKLALRNFAIFLLVLIPVGIRDGML